MASLPAPARPVVTLVALFVLAAAATEATAAPPSARPVKEFSLRVAETEHEFYPGGPKIQASAFNDQVPGPVLRVTEGDLVTNKHTSNHTLHFHGQNVPKEMDGVAYAAPCPVLTVGPRVDRTP